MLQQLYLIDYNIMSGTMQDRLNIAANVIPPGAKFTETDTGNVYIWNGAWIQQTQSAKILPGTAAIYTSTVSGTSGFFGSIQWEEVATV